MSKTTQLWGGAVTVILPENVDFIDASEVREIPDNQEVFVQNDIVSDDWGDKSIIFEIVEYQEHLDLKSTASCVAEFFWNDIASENNSSFNKITSVTEQLLPSLENDSNFSHDGCSSNYRYISVTGVQIHPVKNSAFVTPLIIHLNILRFPKLKTDILVTFHVPGKAQIPEDLLYLLNTLILSNTLQRTQQVAVEMMKTFTILDWSLFNA